MPKRSALQLQSCIFLMPNGWRPQRVWEWLPCLTQEAFRQKGPGIHHLLIHSLDRQFFATRIHSKIKDLDVEIFMVRKILVIVIRVCDCCRFKPRQTIVVHIHRMGDVLGPPFQSRFRWFFLRAKLQDKSVLDSRQPIWHNHNLPSIFPPFPPFKVSVDSQTWSAWGRESSLEIWRLVWFAIFWIPPAPTRSAIARFGNFLGDPGPNLCKWLVNMPMWSCWH